MTSRPSDAPSDSPSGFRSAFAVVAAALLFAAALALSACGGGGSGAATPPEPPPTLWTVNVNGTTLQVPVEIRSESPPDPSSAEFGRATVPGVPGVIVLYKTAGGGYRAVAFALAPIPDAGKLPAIVIPPICGDGGQVFNDAVMRCECPPPDIKVNGECATPSAASCAAVGMVLNPNANNECAAECPDDFPLKESGTCRVACSSGYEDVHGQCLSVCRNFFPRIWNAEDERCECAPGTSGDECRELDRALGTLTSRVGRAHAVVLPDGTRLLGRGVTVGIMEAWQLHWDKEAPDGTTVAATHSDLPSIRVFGYDPAAGVTIYNDMTVTIYNGDPGRAWHGIAVAGIMAAQKNGRGLVGVAPEAGYVYGHANAPDTPGIFEAMIEAGAEIINNSWTPGYWVEAHHFRAENEDGELDLEQTRENLDHYLWHRGMLPGKPEEVSVADFYGQADRHPSERTIFVWSAGNNFGRRITATINLKHYGGPVLDKGGTVAADSLAVVPGLSYYFSDLTLNNVAVAAVNESSQVVSAVDGREVVQREIASFSNRCGANSESFCIAAPGVAFIGYSPADLSIAFEAALKESDCDETDDDYADCVLKVRDLAISIVFRERAETGYGAGFLLAPETDDYNNGYLPPGVSTGRGTSFSAPIVSGALALVKQFFRAVAGCDAQQAEDDGDECGLGSDELIARIMATADKRGIYANSKIYGAGLLDLENALTPQGELRLMSGRSLSESRSFSFSQSGLTPGIAAGDSFRRGWSTKPLAAFDEMNAPFAVSGDGLFAESEAGSHSTGSRLRELQSDGGNEIPVAFWRGDNATAWWSLNAPGDSQFLSRESGNPLSDANGFPLSRERGNDGFRLASEQNNFANPFAALSGDGMVAGFGSGAMRFSAFGESLTDDNAKQTRGALAEFSFHSGTDSAAAMQFGFARESDSALSSVGDGAFANLRAQTTFAGLRFDSPLSTLSPSSPSSERWRIRAALYAGRTSSPDGGAESWWGGTDEVWSASFAVATTRDNVLRFGDSFSFRVAQPLRTESGALILRRPTGRTRRGGLTYATERLNANPSGRELDYEIRYRFPLRDDNGAMSLAAGWTTDPGHRADARSLGRMLFAVDRAF